MLSPGLHLFYGFVVQYSMFKQIAICLLMCVHICFRAHEHALSLFGSCRSLQTWINRVPENLCLLKFPLNLTLWAACLVQSALREINFADLICVFDTSQRTILHSHIFLLFSSTYFFKVCCFGTACWRFTRMQALRKVFASIKGYYFQALMSWKDGVGKTRIIFLFVGYVFVTLVLSGLQTGSAEPWRNLGYARES